MKERLLPSCFGLVRIEKTEAGYNAYLNSVEGQGPDPEKAFNQVVQRVANRFVLISIIQNQKEIKQPMKERLLPSCFGLVRIEKTEAKYNAYLNSVEGEGPDPEKAFNQVIQRVANRFVLISIIQNRFESF